MIAPAVIVAAAAAIIVSLSTMALAMMTAVTVWPRQHGSGRSNHRRQGECHNDLAHVLLLEMIPHLCAGSSERQATARSSKSHSFEASAPPQWKELAQRS
jgi:hypothetical protein